MKSIVLYERVNMEKVRLVSRCMNIQINDSEDIEDQNWLEKFKTKMRYYKPEVVYKQKDGLEAGRFYGNGMQSCPREVRKYLSDGNYMDIDIVNCHPVLLWNFMKMNDIPIPVFLEEYISNRAEAMIKYRLKDKFSVFGIMYSEVVDNKSSDILEFHRVLYSEVAPLFQKMYGNLLVKKEKNTMGSFMARCLQHIENDMLMCMFEKCKELSLKIGVLCYDGMMIEKEDYFEGLLEILKKEVKEKLNYNISLVEKSMETDWVPQDVIEGLEEDTKKIVKGDLVGYQCENGLISVDVDDNDMKRVICKCSDPNHKLNIEKNGYCYKCMNCLSTFPTHSLITIPRECRNMMNYFNIQNLTIVNHNETSDNESKFLVLRKKLLSISQEKMYKKYNGSIYKRNSKNCYVYEEYLKYNKFLEEIFEENTIFNSNISMFRNLLDYLECRNEKKLPNLEHNLDYIAFTNGCLNLRTCEFIKNEDLDKKSGIAARHYIKSLFKVGETPMFDKLVKYQVSDEVYEYFLFFIGRLFFKVKECDNYQVMPFIKGAANTGKSTLVNIIKSAYDGSRIGVVSANQEQTFGLGNFYDKELIICSDMPDNMHTKLDNSLLQDMISGNGLNVPEKQKKAQVVTWTTPMIWASNYFASYPDSQGALARRFIYFLMDKKVISRDTTLEQKIISKELPSLIYKCVRKYKEIITKHKNEDFWSFCPEEFKNVQQESKQSENYIYKFLEAVQENDGVKIWVKFDENKKEDVEVVKRAYTEYMRTSHPTIRYKWSKDNTAWKDFGYEFLRLHVCKACMKPGGSCCAEYDRNNRTKKEYIKNLEMVTEHNNIIDDL